MSEETKFTVLRYDVPISETLSAQLADLTPEEERFICESIEHALAASFLDFVRDGR